MGDLILFLMDEPMLFMGALVGATIWYPFELNGHWKHAPKVTLAIFAVVSMFINGRLAMTGVGLLMVGLSSVGLVRKVRELL